MLHAPSSEGTRSEVIVLTARSWYCHDMQSESEPDMADMTKLTQAGLAEITNSSAEAVTAPIAGGSEGHGLSRDGFKRIPNLGVPQFRPAQDNSK